MSLCTPNLASFLTAGDSFTDRLANDRQSKLKTVKNWATSVSGNSPLKIGRTGNSRFVPRQRFEVHQNPENCCINAYRQLTLALNNTNLLVNYTRRWLNPRLDLDYQATIGEPNAWSKMEFT
jgi:hypothetical protein